MALGNQVPDKTLLQNVLKKIAQKSTGSNRVTATVASGDATLTGTIAYEHDRKPILRAVQSVPGVRRIIDQIKLIVKKKPTLESQARIEEKPT